MSLFCRQSRVVGFGLRGVSRMNMRNRLAAGSSCAVTQDRRASTQGDKKRLVILGSGWAGYRLLRSLDVDQFDVTMISPRNHFLFTPLLASTATGTLAFRSIIDPIRYHSAFGQVKNTFYQAKTTSIDDKAQTVHCEGTVDGRQFDVQYDKLVIAVGSLPNTFGVKGVREYGLFLKELPDARLIREKIIQNFELASIPGVDPIEKKRLLHFVVVGGGPTGTELTAELADFFWEDLVKAFPSIDPSECNLSLFEASGQILGAFDKTLARQSAKAIRHQGVVLETHTVVAEVREKEIILENGSSRPYGMLVWCTGVGPRQLTANLPYDKDPSGRILVDSCLRVPNTTPNTVFALGDCAVMEDQPLPATAQVAVQQGKWLASQFNMLQDHTKSDSAFSKPFNFKFLGMMSYIGHYKSVISSDWWKSSGFISFLLWRSAYFTMLGSIKSRFQVPLDWTKTFVFGRDVTSFSGEKSGSWKQKAG